MKHLNDTEQKYIDNNESNQQSINNISDEIVKIKECNELLKNELSKLNDN